jgi:hypothetical protein
MVDRKTFDLIKTKHGRYASWAVWAQPTGGPKSGIGDLSVLDPDRNSPLLQRLRNDVVMVALNLSRFQPTLLANFHDPSAVAQDYKIRFAFSGTPYYGAYMTDLIKGVVMLESSNLMRHLAENPALISDSIHGLLEEFADLNCAAPTLIAFGNDAYLLAAKHVPSSQYARLVRVTHYSHYISKEEYRHRVLAQLTA